MGTSEAKRLETEASLRQAKAAAQLTDWRQLTRPASCPIEVYTALQSGRTELLRAVKPAPLTGEATAAVYDLIATLIETNRALQKHAEQTAHLVKTWGGSFRQLESLGRRIEAFANFKEEEEEQDV